MDWPPPTPPASIVPWIALAISLFSLWYTRRAHEHRKDEKSLVLEAYLIRRDAPGLSLGIVLRNNRAENVVVREVRVEKPLGARIGDNARNITDASWVSLTEHPVPPGTRETVNAAVLLPHGTKSITLAVLVDLWRRDGESYRRVKRTMRITRPVDI